MNLLHKPPLLFHLLCDSSIGTIPHWLIKERQLRYFNTLHYLFSNNLNSQVIFGFAFYLSWLQQRYARSSNSRVERQYCLFFPRTSNIIRMGTTLLQVIWEWFHWFSNSYLCASGEKKKIKPPGIFRGINIRWLALQLQSWARTVSIQLQQLAGKGHAPGWQMRTVPPAQFSGPFSNGKGFTAPLSLRKNRRGADSQNTNKHQQIE